MQAARTLFDKIWDAHIVSTLPGGDVLLYIDRHFVLDLASNIAFDRLRAEREFLEQGEKISEGFTPMSAPDVETVVGTLADTPSAAVDYTKALMRKQGLRIQ